MKNKKIITLLILLTVAFSAKAQDDIEFVDSIFRVQSVTALKHYKVADNLFVSAYFGGNFSMSENTRFLKWYKNFNPTYALSFGKWLFPAVGVRLKLEHMIQTGSANQEAVEAYPEVYGNGKYKFKLYSISIDALTNLTNVITPYKESTKLNFYTLMGLGFLRTFGFDNRLKEWANFEPAPYVVYKHPKNYLVGHVGVGAYYELRKNIDIGMEITGSITNDKYNGVTDDQMYDSFMEAQVFVTYHFRDHFGDYRFKYVTLSDTDLMLQLNQRINKARKTLKDEQLAQEEKAQKIMEEENKPVEKPEPVKVVKEQPLEILDLEVRFPIDQYKIVSDEQKQKVEIAANYLREHPDDNMIVTGYADVQTAYPAYNLKLSQRRAQHVFNYLVKVYGIDPKRLKIDYKGDTVQPYIQHNNWNRVVIFVIQHKK